MPGFSSLGLLSYIITLTLKTGCTIAQHQRGVPLTKRVGGRKVTGFPNLSGHHTEILFDFTPSRLAKLRWTEILRSKEAKQGLPIAATQWEWSQFTMSYSALAAEEGTNGHHSCRGSLVDLTSLFPTAVCIRWCRLCLSLCSFPTCFSPKTALAANPGLCSCLSVRC